MLPQAYPTKERPFCIVFGHKRRDELVIEDYFLTFEKRENLLNAYSAWLAILYDVGYQLPMWPVKLTEKGLENLTDVFLEAESMALTEIKGKRNLN